MLRSRPAILWLGIPQDQPAGQPLRLSAGQPFIASFVWSANLYQFTATVVQNGWLKLSGGGEQEAIRATCPERLVRVQRRGDYRHELSPAERLEVQVWNGGVRARDVARARRAVLRGRMLNVSAGGTRLRLDAPPDAPVAAGETLGVEFLLDGRVPLQINAIVRHAIATDDGGVELGVEFLGLDRRPAGTRIRDMLSRWIFQKQRQTLRRPRLA